METREVKFTWIKGHSGDPLNEHCDKLAKVAANGNVVDKKSEEENTMKNESVKKTAKEIRAEIKVLKASYAVKVETEKANLLREKNRLAEIKQDGKVKIAKAQEKILTAVNKEDAKIARAELAVEKTEQQIKVAEANNKVAKIKLELLKAVAEAEKDLPKKTAKVSEQKKKLTSESKTLEKPEKEKSDPIVIPQDEVKKAVEEEQSDENIVEIEDVNNDFCIETALNGITDLENTKIVFNANVSDTDRVYGIIKTIYGFTDKLKNYSITWNKENTEQMWQQMRNICKSIGVKIAEKVVA